MLPSTDGGNVRLNHMPSELNFRIEVHLMHIVSSGLKMLPNLVNSQTVLFAILLINTLSVRFQVMKES